MSAPTLHKISAWVGARLQRRMIVTLAAVLAGGSGAATGWTAHDAGSVIFAHPTLDEALEAAMEALQEPA